MSSKRFGREVFPPTQISVPPLRVYTFIPVTGQIISRQVVVEQASPESAESAESPAPAAAKAKAKVAAVGAGSAAGIQPPQVPNPVGQVVAGGNAKADSDDAEDEDADIGEAEEGDDLEAELAKLETLNKKKSKAGQKKESKSKKHKAA